MRNRGTGKPAARTAVCLAALFWGIFFGCCENPLERLELVKSSDVRLQSLSVKSGNADGDELIANFNPKTLSYSLNVPSEVSSLYVYATPADSKAEAVYSNNVVDNVFTISPSAAQPPGLP